MLRARRARAGHARRRRKGSRSSTARRRTRRSRALALVDAHRLWRTAHVAGAMSLEALLGTPVAFDARIQDVRGQLGQAASAALPARAARRQRDPRVAPRQRSARAGRVRAALHAAGARSGARRARLRERRRSAASSTPRPTIRSCSRSGDLLSGGNFHGQSVAMALDFLAIALTNLATISERRIDRLVHPDLNQGLPPFLARDAGVNSGLHDGAGHGGGARERVQGAVASGERRHDSDRRQQGRRRADGDGRGVEAAPRRARTCATCSRSS